MLNIKNALERAELCSYLEEPLCQNQEERLKAFLELRSKWSQTHNLSGPKALTLLSTDVVDAVAVWLCVDPEKPLVDIGSGSGVPGVMLACLAPTQEIHLVEPIAKRCAFMKTAVYQLGLKHVKVHRSRWPDKRFRDLNDSIPISRAVVSPEEWPSLANQPQVSGIMQMLAHQRPEWPLENFNLVKEVSYLDPEGGSRLVRRWKKQNT